MAYHKFTTNYFNSRSPGDWDFSNFIAEFTQQHPTIRLGEANSRFLTALQKIVASPPSISASHKAQSLIDTHKRRNQKKRTGQSDSVVIHGGVSIAPDVQVISTRDGNVSITGQAKRRRREPTPEPGEDRQDEENGSEDNERDGGDGDQSDVDSSKTTTPQPSNHPLRTFLATFSTMQNKRQFTSGRILEDIIHTRVTQDPSSAGDAIYWVIDLSNSTVCSWFGEDLSELQSWAPSTPKVDEYFTYARKRNQLYWTSVRLRNQNRHLQGCAGAILSMIEQSSSNESFGTQGHKEGWYGSKLWSTILDHCMDDMDNFTVSRTDIRSKSGCPGKRFDAIFLGFAGVEIAEFGAVEVARTADVLASGKRTCDEEKLRDVMAAMLTALLVHVDHDVEASKLLQVVGVQQVGFNIRISTICSLRKGVFLLKRGIWRKVPNKLENFDTVFDVMQSVVVMKKIIQRTVETIKRYHDKKAELAEGFEL